MGGQLQFRHCVLGGADPLEVGGQGGAVGAAGPEEARGSWEGGGPGGPAPPGYPPGYTVEAGVASWGAIVGGGAGGAEVMWRLEKKKTNQEKKLVSPQGYICPRFVFI